MDGLPPILPSLSRRSIAWIFVFGATMFLVDFGPGWVLTYHEAYFAEPAREMLRTGDWLIPRIGGIPSWQKPPLTHWMIAASLGTLHTESEWAVRLPTLLCTIFNAIFIAALAARWHGDRIGRLAGLIQLTLFYTLFQGRLAESDMPLCAAVTGSMLALAYGTIGREKCSIWPKIGYFAAAGLSTLIKGPFGLALIGGAAGLFAIIERRRSVWRFLLDPAGWIVMLILTLVWPIAAYRADSSILDALRVHNLDRFSGTYDGQTQSPVFYAYIIPGLLIPWLPVAVGGLIAVWKDPARPKELWRLMACWMFVGIALISASAWKHKHYPIPMLPPCSIMAAYGLDRYIRSARRSGFSPAAFIALLIAIGGSISAVILGFRGSSNLAVISILLALAGVGLSFTVRRRRAGNDDQALVALFATIWLVVVLNQSFVLPQYDLYRPHVEMARRINAIRKPGEVLDVVEIAHPQIYYYLRFPIRRFDSWTDYANQVSGEPGQKTIVGSAQVVKNLARLGRAEVIDRANAWTPAAAVTLTPDPSRIAAALSDKTVVR